jgi:c-di-GMP-binding flagellar brake protein YcgR
MNKNNQYSGNERRKYIRVHSADIIECKRFTAEDLMSGTTDMDVKSTTKNISAGGILFQADIKFDIGELLKVEVVFPGWEQFKVEFYKGDALTETKPLVALVTVVRVEPIPGSEEFDVAACFSAIDQGHQWALRKFVEKNGETRSPEYPEK